MGEIPKWIPKKIREEAEKLGGIDVDESDDGQETQYYNKKDHAERSIFHQPNHLIFWKKQEAKKQEDEQ